MLFNYVIIWFTCDFCYFKNDSRVAKVEAMNGDSDDILI